MRYFLKLSYRGTNYNGWQIQTKQANKVTVQGKVQEALSKLLRTPTTCMGQGRTDTGVHAKTFYAHFDFEGPLPDQLLMKLNHFLPDDIAIHQIIPVADNAHARFDATQRSYEYHLHFEKNVFLHDLSYLYPYPLDLGKVFEATRLIPSFTDFAPLSKKSPDVKTTICHISEARWETLPGDAGLILHLSANRFLRNMVRRVVGALLSIGRGKLEIEGLREAMEKRENLRINLTAPPQGLYLRAVKYPYIGNS